MKLLLWILVLAKYWLSLAKPNLSMIFHFWKLWDNLEHYLVMINECESRSIRFALICLTVRCLQVTILGLVEFSEYHQLLMHDMALFYDYPIEINLLATVFGIQTMAFLWKMTFYKNRSKTLVHSATELVYQVLYKQDNRFFLERRIHGKVVFISKKGRHQLTIAQIIQRVTKLLLLICQYFFAIITVEVIYFYFYLMHFVILNWRNFFASGLLGYVQLAVAYVNALLNTFYFLCFSAVNINATVIIFVFSWCCFIRLRQIDRLIDSSSRRFNVLQLNRFIRLHTQTLLTIFRGNGYFGQLLLSFIVLYIPVNTFLLIQIVTGNGYFSALQSYVFSNVLVFQSVYIFGFHLVAAAYTNRIHACRKPLFHWITQRRVSLSALGRVRLANYIAKFHCKKRYGITYDTFGLMSFYSFTKFVLIYSQLIMYIYELINRI